MTLDQLFQKRQNRSLKEQMKYAKIIMNDHFILLLFILLGAGGYAYANYLDTLSIGMMAPRLLLLLLYFLMVSTGAVTLYLEPADQIFLLPKEEAYHTVFKKHVIQSYVLSLIPMGVVVFLSYPILVATTPTTAYDLLYLFFGLSGLKVLHFLQLIQPFFIEDETKIRKDHIRLLVLKLIGISGLLFFNPLFASTILLLIGIVYLYRFLSNTLFPNQWLRWDKLIEAEEKRMQRLYRLLGMFVNVPNIQTTIKRLPWLDGVLDWLSQRNKNAPYYYVLRLVARNTEYSSMIVRAIIVGTILQLMTDSIVLSAIFLILFLYIIGFQLLSLVREINKTPQFQIYPIQSDVKRKAVLRLIVQILLFVNIFLSIAAAFNIGVYSFGILLIGLFFLYIFTNVYAPKRLQR